MKLFLVITLITLTSSQLLQPNPCYQEKMREIEDAVDDDLDTELYNDRVEAASMMAKYYCLSIEDKIDDFKQDKKSNTKEVDPEKLRCFRNELKKFKPDSNLVDDEIETNCDENIFNEMKSEYEFSFKSRYENLRIKVCTLEEFASEKDVKITYLEAILLASSNFDAERIKQDQIKIINSIVAVGENVFGCILREMQSKK